MLKKQNAKYKILYNNYQFYENAVLLEMIEKQKKEGYYPCAIIGESCNLLKFSYGNTETAKESYAVSCKNLDKEIDDEITHIQAEEGSVLCQNNRYLIHKVDSSEAALAKFDHIQMKQNLLLSVPVKKCAALISILLILSVISLIPGILFIRDGSDYFNAMCYVLFLSLIINFMIYFIGDIHDLIAGKGSRAGNLLFFTRRSRFKDRLFHIGDLLKWLLLLGSIGCSIGILLVTRDGVLAVRVFSMWFLFCGIGFIYRLRVHGSYLSLLITELCLFMCCTIIK